MFEWCQRFLILIPLDNEHDVFIQSYFVEFNAIKLLKFPSTNQVGHPASFDRNTNAAYAIFLQKIILINIQVQSIQGYRSEITSKRMYFLEFEFKQTYS